MQSKKINLKEFNEKDYNLINEAGEQIKKGNLVVFPTETVYGIGANAFDNHAVKKIFLAKGRAQDNPLILHISDMSMLNDFVENTTEIEQNLMKEFWPGPFTIILNKKEGIATEATCSGNTVGVRMPSNKIAQQLIRVAGVPIAAPSANISGKPSGTKIEDIICELEGKVDYIIDGGSTDIGLESTVVRVIDDEVKILRPGKITKEDIEKVVNKVEFDKHLMQHIKDDEKVLSPGMKYRHYAPKTHCKLVYSENNEKIINSMKTIAQNYDKNRVLILSTTENLEEFKEYKNIGIGSQRNLLEISHNIFSALRKIDSYDVDIAIIEGVKSEGLGIAIMNRLIRACEYDYLVY